MDIATAIQQLEREWDRTKPGDFFGELYNAARFDQDAWQRVVGILNSVEIPDGEMLNRRFVEVTWFMPTHMHWQREVWEIDGNEDLAALNRAIEYIEQRLTTILGLP